MPLYLTQTRGWDLKQIALLAWLPFLAADCGCLFGDALNLWLQKYWRISLINACRAAFTLGAGMMLGVGFVGFVQSPYAAIALLSLAGFAHQTLSVFVITSRLTCSRRMRWQRLPGCELIRQRRSAHLLASYRRADSL
jgi:ACS family hexuronate transporter-like MFS transporter